MKSLGRKVVVVVTDPNGCLEPRLFSSEFIGSNVHGEPCNLVIYDPPQTPVFDGVRRLAYSHASIIVLRYDGRSLHSLMAVVEQWRQDLVRYGATVEIPVAVVADRSNCVEQVALVSETEFAGDAGLGSRPGFGVEVAARIGAVGYVECCRRTRQGIPELVAFLAGVSLPKPENTPGVEEVSKKVRKLRRCRVM